MLGQGITPTIIQLRVVMGRSFHDQESMVEVTSSLHFASDHPNPNPETGSISIERQERSEDFDIEVSNRDILWGFHLGNGQILIRVAHFI